MKFRGRELEGETVVGLVGNRRVASIDDGCLEVGKKYKVGRSGDMSEQDAGVCLSDGYVAFADDEKLEEKVSAGRDSAPASKKGPKKDEAKKADAKK